MATQNQNPNAENQHQQNKDFTQENPNAESAHTPQSGKRGLEQNDHTYEGENDVTHSPQKTGQPQNQNTANDSSRDQSKAETGQPKAGYNQAEHDQTPETNPKNANASDPRESKEPKKGNL